MNSLSWFGVVVGALLAAACDRAVCPSYTVLVGERCVLKPDAGLFQEAQAGARAAKHGCSGSQCVAGRGAQTAAESLAWHAARGTMRAHGEGCSGDSDCASGHCDVVCCAKGSDCCRTIADCPVDEDGVGRSCSERARCQGVVGEMRCSSDHRCVVKDGVRDDSGCSPRIEANDCGPFPAVYCRGQPRQNGPPPCAATCRDDGGCDLGAHCAAGICLPDSPDG